MINQVKSDEKGIALVVTLLALVLITAMVVEFSYGVYTGTNDLYNWRDSQRLSLMAKSGVNLAARGLPDVQRTKMYSTGPLEYPVENPFEDFTGTVTVRIEDESGKFNINSLINTNNTDAYDCFVRLVKVLSLDKSVADRIRNYILKKSETGTSGSTANTTTRKLLSTDELLLIDGISRKVYDTLLPYVTVYGPDKDKTLRIDINGASKAVLMCLSEKITSELAQRIIDYRRDNPFTSSSAFNDFVGLKMDIPPSVATADGNFFAISATASSGGVKRVIETVLDTNLQVRYWKEY